MQGKKCVFGCFIAKHTIKICREVRGLEGQQKILLVGHGADIQSTNLFLTERVFL